MKTVFCPSCKGTKTIQGLGMIFHDCKTCEGIGYVKREDDEPIQEVAIKRKGRPRKNDKRYYESMA